MKTDSPYDGTMSLFDVSVYKIDTIENIAVNFKICLKPDPANHGHFQTLRAAPVGFLCFSAIDEELCISWSLMLSLLSSPLQTVLQNSPLFTSVSDRFSLSPPLQTDLPL